MSFTEVIEEKTPTKTRKYETKILLTPNKRRRVDFTDGRNVAAGNVEVVDEDAKPKSSLPALMQCYNWTFTKDAIATCFVRDVMELRQEPQHEFFWLGRVPCRTVRVMGIVVGVVQKEKDTWYTVDDGTAVIDCILKHPKPVKHVDSTSTKQSKYKYIPKSETASKPRTDDVYKPPPPPVAKVGQLVRVQGKVVHAREWFNLRVEEGGISVCHWNDEPLHWKTVVELHRTNYDIPQPFQIPVPIRPPSPVPTTPVQNRSPQQPSSTVAPSSAAKSDVSDSTKRKAPRLRHPSRLHSRDLTDNTFRIYVRHYMDNAPRFRPSTFDNDKSDDRLRTPTKSQRYASPQTTPTQSSIDVKGKGKRLLDADDDETQYGFTLSYLRRVPVLSLLANRVVCAERRRRDRESRNAERGKEKAQSSRQQSHPGSSESTAKKNKRLFAKAIRDLYAEGSIVLWDGPIRPWWTAAMIDEEERRIEADTSDMWKTASSIGTVNSTLTSSYSTSNTLVNTLPHEDEDPLSDPSPSEESYISVTPSFLSPIVENAIGVLIARAQRHRPQTKNNNAQFAKQASSFAPTAEGILKYLRASDGRWANLGVWVVEDALKALVEEGRVVRKTEGRWQLCL